MRYRSRPARLLAAAAVSALISSLAVAPSAGNAAVVNVPAPDDITVELVSVNGPGCPVGTAIADVSPDRHAFTIAYDRYIVQSGPGISPVEGRKNCALRVKVHVPNGITFAIAEADYRGFADLSRRAKLVQKASYYFAGNSLTVPVEHVINGEKYDNWQTTDITPVAALIWRPCGEDRLFVINTELRVLRGNDPNKIEWGAMDSTDGSISTVYHMAFRTCPT
jgi:hypothetical protein